jgi:hypothetical protein
MGIRDTLFVRRLWSALPSSCSPERILFGHSALPLFWHLLEWLKLTVTIVYPSLPNRTLAFFGIAKPTDWGVPFPFAPRLALQLDRVLSALPGAR